MSAEARCGTEPHCSHEPLTRHPERGPGVGASKLVIAWNATSGAVSDTVDWAGAQIGEVPDSVLTCPEVTVPNARATNSNTDRPIHRPRRRLATVRPTRRPRARDHQTRHPGDAHHARPCPRHHRDHRRGNQADHWREVSADQERVRIRPLTSRLHLAWMVATGVAVLVIFTVVFITQPDNRVFVLVVGPLFALYVIALSWRSIWLEPAEGALLMVRWRVYHRRVPLGPGTQIALVPNRAGELLLGARPPSVRRRLYVPILALTVYVERSQDPAVLRLLADTLQRHGTGGGPTVVRQLRAQAEYIEAGGHPRTSPLAASVTHTAAPMLKSSNGGH